MLPSWKRSFLTLKYRSILCSHSLRFTVNWTTRFLLLDISMDTLSISLIIEQFIQWCSALSHRLCWVFAGADGETRTHSLLITNQLRCHCATSANIIPTSAIDRLCLILLGLVTPNCTDFRPLNYPLCIASCYRQPTLCWIYYKHYPTFCLCKPRSLFIAVGQQLSTWHFKPEFITENPNRRLGCGSRTRTYISQFMRLLRSLFSIPQYIALFLGELIWYRNSKIIQALTLS